jgi:hypothetical protein
MNWIQSRRGHATNSWKVVTVPENKRFGDTIELLVGGPQNDVQYRQY